MPEPIDEALKFITDRCWIVELCPVAALHQKAQYVITFKAKEAIQVHKGCAKCKIYIPEDRLAFEDSLHA